MNKKPRGNKTSKAERAKRQADALALMKTGATQEAIADRLGVSRTTFWRDLQAIEARYVEGSKDDVAAFKKSQYDALIRIESATAEGSIPPDVANALTRIRDSVARLLGLNEPSRSENLNLTADLGEMQAWQRAVYELRHVPEVLHAEFWQRSQSLIKELAKPPLLGVKKITDGGGEDGTH